MEAAGYVAQAEATVRQQLARIGAAMKASPELTRGFYREIFDGMTMTPAENDERPRRVSVEGAVRLVRADVTPQRLMRYPGPQRQRYFFVILMTYASATEARHANDARAWIFCGRTTGVARPNA